MDKDERRGIGVDLRLWCDGEGHIANVPLVRVPTDAEPDVDDRLADRPKETNGISGEA